MAMRKDAAEHRQRILQTAESLFSQYGVDSVSMHQIAKLSGIGQGTLYRNYANKADLCLDLIRESGRELDRDIREVCGSERFPTARAKLEELLRLLIGFLEARAPWLGAMQDARCPEGGGSSFYRSPVYEALHGYVRSILEKGIREGECRAGLDPVLGADSLLAALDSDLYLFLTRGRGYTPEQVLAHLLQFNLHALFLHSKNG